MKILKAKKGSTDFVQKEKLVTQRKLLAEQVLLWILYSCDHRQKERALEFLMFNLVDASEFKPPLITIDQHDTD